MQVKPVDFGKNPGKSGVPTDAGARLEEAGTLLGYSKDQAGLAVNI